MKTQESKREKEIVVKMNERERERSNQSPLFYSYVQPLPLVLMHVCTFVSMYLSERKIRQVKVYQDTSPLVLGYPAAAPAV